MYQIAPSSNTLEVSLLRVCSSASSLEFHARKMENGISIYHLIYEHNFMIDDRFDRELRHATVNH